MIAEAPIPCNILATVNMAKDEDKAQNNDVEQNIVVPIKKIRLYPYCRITPRYKSYHITLFLQIETQHHAIIFTCQLIDSFQGRIAGYRRNRAQELQ